MRKMRRARAEGKARTQTQSGGKRVEGAEEGADADF